MSDETSLGNMQMTIDIERSTAVMPSVDKGKRKPGFLRPALAALLSYLEKRETRGNLRDLTDDQLRDIGVTPAEARAEINKSWFWG